MDSNEPLETVIEVNPPTGDDNEETNEKEEGVVRSSSHSESTHTTTQRWGERVTTSRGDTDGTQPLSVSSEPGHDTPAWNASEDAFEANQNGIHTSEDVSTTRRSYDTVSNFYVDVDGDSESTPSFSFLTPHDRRFGSPAAHSRPASALRNGQRFQYPEEETKSETLTSGRKPLLKSNSSHSSVSETKPEGTPGANSSSYADENSETNGSLANAGDTDSKQQKDESSIQKTKQSISEIEGWRVNASERNGRNISGNNVDTQVLLYKNMEEKSYIPVDLAQTYLRRAVEDMRSMKQRHVDAIHKIDHHYKEKSKQTKKQHEKEKLEIRKRAGERILAYQKRLEDKENEVQKFTETLEQAKRDVELKWSDENDNLRKDMYSANRKLYEHVNILEEDKTNYVLAVEQLKAQSVKYDERNNENKQMLDDLKKQLDTEASCRKKQVYSRECHISTLESQIQYWKALCQSLQEEVENSSKQSQQVEGLEKKMTAETLQMRKMIEQHESEQKATVDSKGDQRQSESILSNNLSYIEGLLQVTGDDVEKLSEEVERCEKMVAVSQSELDSEEEDYQAKHKEYKHLKHEIKDWIAAYEAEHNEKPDKEAKRAIKDKYKRYEALQPEVHEKPKKIEEAKQRVEDANAELRIARSRLQLAQALAKSNGRASAEADNQSEEEEYKDSTTNNDYSLDQRKEIEDLQKEKEGLEEELAETQEKLAELESKLDSVTLERDLAKARSITQARKNTEEGAEESNIDSSDVHSIVQKLRQLLDRAKQAIDDGAAMWKEGKKRDTLHLYQGEVTQLVDDLGEEKAFQRMKEELNATVDDANEVVSSSPGKAAVILRQGLDDFIQMAGEALSNAIGEEGAGDKQSLQKHVEELESRLQQFQSSHEAKEASKASETPKAKDNSAWRRRALSAEKKAENLSTKVKELEKEKEQLEQKIKDSESSTSSGAESKAKVSKPAAGSNPKDKEKIDQLQKNLKELRQKLKNAENKANDNQMSMQLKEAEKAKVQAEKRVEMVERKAKKEQEDLQKEMEGEVSKVQKKLERTEKTLKETEEQVSQLTKEKNDLKVKVGSLDSAEKELESLREKAEEGKRLKQELEDLKKEHEEISNAYREEQLLRKKYWNMMEDMKGKIRVYCRSRPLSTSELERGNYSVARIPDSCTIHIETPRGPKEFVYDSVFGEETTQENIFQESENLVQSAFDGYNVCIFAYGQTGSGKTFTMVGNEHYPGIAPRAVQRLFELIDENKKLISTKVSVYMVELYNDQFQDLLWRADNLKTKQKDAPRLEIKKDKNGMVFIKGSVMKTAESAEDVMKIFNLGNSSRATSSTSMNAESSRSHLVFAIMLEAYNKKTGKTSLGKLSLVDLAGSERQAKTGAKNERLKEAQSINLSLSALGNVISQLSNGEKFIRYRDNKLTQLMQDSIGGNAKTLMFVNISPADYNREETLTSLRYASRVKMITNEASKQQESEEVNRLQNCIDKLKEHFGEEAEKVIEKVGIEKVPEKEAQDQGNDDQENDENEHENQC